MKSQVGPFRGERWGAYEILAEMPTQNNHRVFLTRCFCGAVSAHKRGVILDADEKPILGCEACRGNRNTTRTTFPPRWPDGIYGSWRLIERIKQDKLWVWRMTCRTCGKKRIEERLREFRVAQECADCALRKRRKARMVARAAARGTPIVRIELR